ncbi:MAG: hypothetical protein KBG43_07630 [Paludibacteraceae bacterium]|nr:hypothetical protein [Paludibacteraceae bacterium]
MTPSYPDSQIDGINPDSFFLSRLLSFPFRMSQISRKDENSRYSALFVKPAFTGLL